MMALRKFPLAAIATLLLFSPFSRGASAIEVGPRVRIDTVPSKFDFMAFDKKARIALAAHPGARKLELLDTKAKKVIGSVLVGEAQGVAVDEAGGRYFTGNDGEHSITVIQAKSFQVEKTIPLPDPIDAIAFDSKRSELYAAADNGDHLWVVNPLTGKTAERVEIPGKPEWLEYDATSDRLYLNLKDKNQLAILNPATRKVEQTFSTLPAEDPHGLALDQKKGLVYVAGRNSKLVAIDVKTGKVKAETKIGPGNDQLVFDAKEERLWSAGKLNLSVVSTKGNGLHFEASLPTPPHSHTLALDPVDHGVWITSFDASESFFQNYRFP